LNSTQQHYPSLQKIYDSGKGPKLRSGVQLPIYIHTSYNRGQYRYRIEFQLAIMTPLYVGSLTETNWNAEHAHRETMVRSEAERGMMAIITARY